MHEIKRKLHDIRTAKSMATTATKFEFQWLLLREQHKKRQSKFPNFSMQDQQQILITLLQHVTIFRCL